MEEEIYNMDFTIEKDVKEKVIVKFAAKQHGAFNVFKYYWQPFVWAAVIGLRNNDRRELVGEKEQIFNFGTMLRNGGAKCVQALICMVIARHGSIDIMKKPKDAIIMINEYANGGFYEIIRMMEDNEFGINDLENVKQEIFGREQLD